MLNLILRRLIYLAIIRLSINIFFPKISYLYFLIYHFLYFRICRHLPNPCKAFYTARLHDQSWVRGDYSDVMVTMSRVYEVIRGDEKVVSNDNEKQVI